jgi:hypothetical protein
VQGFLNGGKAFFEPAHSLLGICGSRSCRSWTGLLSNTDAFRDSLELLQGVVEVTLPRPRTLTFGADLRRLV